MSLPCHCHPGLSLAAPIQRKKKKKQVVARSDGKSHDFRTARLPSPSPQVRFPPDTSHPARAPTLVVVHWALNGAGIP